MGQSGSIWYLFRSVTMHLVFVWISHNVFVSPCDCLAWKGGGGRVLQHDVSVLHRGGHSFCSKTGTIAHRVDFLLAAFRFIIVGRKPLLSRHLAYFNTTLIQAQCLVTFI